MVPHYTRGDKCLSAVAYVLQIYATLPAQEFNQFLRSAYGINNLSKSLHSTPDAGKTTSLRIHRSPGSKFNELAFNGAFPPGTYWKFNSFVMP